MIWNEVVAKLVAILIVSSELLPFFQIEKQVSRKERKGAKFAALPQLIRCDRCEKLWSRIDSVQECDASEAKPRLESW